MCLAVPVQILEMDGFRALCGAGGVTVRARLDVLEEPAVGDWVLVHAGFAIAKVEADEAEETWRIFEEAADRAAE
jgi:hydrogenase expression/formation protein HypC